MLDTTALYACLLGALMALLSIRVPMRRGALDVPYGDGGDAVLATRIRAFGNFTEYVPMILVMVSLLELRQAPSGVLHGLGAALVAARVLHALAYRGHHELTLAQKIGRGVAAMSTWLVLCVATGYLLATLV